MQLYWTPSPTSKLRQTVPHRSFSRRRIVNTYTIGNRSRSSSSTHHALIGNVFKFIRTDLLHIKCKLCTYFHPHNHYWSTSILRETFKTVPVTWPFAYDVTERDCCTDYAVTDSMCILRRASKARIHQCWDPQIFSACKSMRKIFIKCKFVIKPAWNIRGVSAEHTELFGLKICWLLAKRRRKNNRRGTIWGTLAIA